MKNIDNEFYNKYPRIYAVAETYCFTKEDIEQMIENEIMLDEQCQKVFQDREMCELSLRMLICKIDVNKGEFRRKVKELANKNSEIEIKELVGWQQVNVVYALAGQS
ncbi:hypothetical protein ACM1RC_26040 [Paenibacillus azoreducens]|uniref:hypothetical protein n=1 Tax=Paenibacillus azoreducens TaxID=116718 RepID=UPI0039F46807